MLLQGEKVINALLDAEDPLLERIAFKDTDETESAARIKYDQEQEALEQEKAATKELQAFTLEVKRDSPKSAAFVAKRIIDFYSAHEGESFTKVGLKKDPEFMAPLEEYFVGADKDYLAEQFALGWSFLETVLTEFDESLPLLTTIEGTRNRGTKYVMEDPEFVQAIWQLDFSSGEDLEVDPDEEYQAAAVEAQHPQAVKVVHFNGKQLRMSDGNEVELGSKVAQSFYDALKNTEKGQWLSRNKVAHDIARHLNMNKDDVEAEIRQLISTLGKNFIASSYNDNGRKTLIKHGKSWSDFAKKRS